MTDGAQDSLIALLMQAHRLFYRYLAPVLRAEEIAFSDVMVLKALSCEGEGPAGAGAGARITDLGREIGLPFSTMTAVIDRLERLGYVQRVHDRADRRSVRVRPTERWAVVAQRLRQRVDAELADILSGLPPERASRLAEDLAALVTVLRERLAARDAGGAAAPGGEG